MDILDLREDRKLVFCSVLSIHVHPSYSATFSAKTFHIDLIILPRKKIAFINCDCHNGVHLKKEFVSDLSIFTGKVASIVLYGVTYTPTKLEYTSLESNAMCYKPDARRYKSSTYRNADSTSREELSSMLVRCLSIFRNVNLHFSRSRDVYDVPTEIIVSRRSLEPFIQPERYICPPHIETR